MNDYTVYKLALSGVKELICQAPTEINAKWVASAMSAYERESSIGFGCYFIVEYDNKEIFRRI